jgi:3-isopropylmalate dehydratase small subunit
MYARLNVETSQGYYGYVRENQSLKLAVEESMPAQAKVQCDIYHPKCSHKGMLLHMHNEKEKVTSMFEEDESKVLELEVKWVNKKITTRREENEIEKAKTAQCRENM